MNVEVLNTSYKIKNRYDAINRLQNEISTNLVALQHLGDTVTTSEYKTAKGQKFLISNKALKIAIQWQIDRDKSSKQEIIADLEKMVKWSEK